MVLNPADYLTCVFKLSLLFMYLSLSVVVKIITTSPWQQHQIQSSCCAMYRWGLVHCASLGWARSPLAVAGVLAQWLEAHRR